MNEITARDILAAACKVRGNNMRMCRVECYAFDDLGRIAMIHAGADGFRENKWQVPGANVMLGELPTVAVFRTFLEHTGIALHENLWLPFGYARYRVFDTLMFAVADTLVRAIAPQNNVATRLWLPSAVSRQPLTARLLNLPLLLHAAELNLINREPILLMDYRR